ncbi:MAG: hypothetical protein AAB403_03590 [Planctomycetota bacterium]
MTDRRRFTGTCPTRHHVILAYLWEEYPRWVPAPELIKLELPYGITGSSGDVRARELARGDCPEKLKGKVERAEGRDIGLDKRFTYYRYKPQTAPSAVPPNVAGPRITLDEAAQIGQENVEMFENYQSSATA